MSVRPVLLTPLAAAVLILTLSAARCGSIGNTSITTSTTGGDSGGEVRWWISADTVDCYGMVPRTCLQIATTAGGEYELHPFDFEIRGFVHEAGTSYVIDVKITEIEDPPADASSLRYDLVRIVEAQS